MSDFQGCGAGPAPTGGWRGSQVYTGLSSPPPHGHSGFVWVLSSLTAFKVWVYVSEDLYFLDSSRFTEVFLRPLDPHQSWPGTLPVLGDTIFPSGLGLPALSVTAEVRVNLAFCPRLLCLRSVRPDKQFY